MWQSSSLVEQLDKARRYTLTLIDSVPESQWFQFPHEGVTHVAWQVGHLAVVEYRLVLERRRGVRPGDEELLPEAFGQLFGKGSTPVVDPALSPSVTEIRRVLDNVHQKALSELVETSAEVFAEPVSAPHPMFSDKGAAVQWCAMHEMFHTGEIALLRRLLGHAPLR